MISCIKRDSIFKMAKEFCPCPDFFAYKDLNQP